MNLMIKTAGHKMCPALRGIVGFRKEVLIQFAEWEPQAWVNLIV